jgi:hypothetical protein
MGLAMPGHGHIRGGTCSRPRYALAGRLLVDQFFTLLVTSVARQRSRSRARMFLDDGIWRSAAWTTVCDRHLDPARAGNLKKRTRARGSTKAMSRARARSAPGQPHGRSRSAGYQARIVEPRTVPQWAYSPRPV